MEVAIVWLDQRVPSVNEMLVIKKAIFSPKLRAGDLVGLPQAKDGGTRG
jgi:hypothetical protein